MKNSAVIPMTDNLFEELIEATILECQGCGAQGETSREAMMEPDKETLLSFCETGDDNPVDGFYILCEKCEKEIQ